MLEEGRRIVVYIFSLYSTVLLASREHPFGEKAIDCAFSLLRRRVVVMVDDVAQGAVRTLVAESRFPAGSCTFTIIQVAMTTVCNRDADLPSRPASQSIKAPHRMD